MKFIILLNNKHNCYNWAVGINLDTHTQAHALAH